MKNSLERKFVQPLIDLAAAEDIGSGDVTSGAIFKGDDYSRAKIICKDTGIFCGGETALWVYETVAPEVRVKILSIDGSMIDNGNEVILLEGPTAGILAGERIALNFLQRMCGIATKTRRMTNILGNDKLKILDTRKTLPGFRHIDKYCVRTGGGLNHRFGLYDMVMIKDNHITAAGTITEAVRRVKEQYGDKYKIEVETANPYQAAEAANAGVDIIMLDNMDTASMIQAVNFIAGRSQVEISGNITADRLNEIKSIGADFVSIGVLTHSVEAFDLSMLFFDE